MRGSWLFLSVVALLNSPVLLFPAPLMPRLVKDFNTNTESTAFASPPFALLNGIAYFCARDPFEGWELWRSDGTEAGTWMVLGLEPRPGNLSPANVVVWKNQIFFSAVFGTNQTALMKSDGTSNGTFVVKSGFTLGADPSLGGLAAVGDLLFFYGNDGVHHRELWASDGTTEGYHRCGRQSGVPRVEHQWERTLGQRRHSRWHHPPEGH
jgi:ELWxxDGT repeat protein